MSHHDTTPPRDPLLDELRALPPVPAPPGRTSHVFRAARAAYRDEHALARLPVVAAAWRLWARAEPVVLTRAVVVALGWAVSVVEGLYR